MSDIPGPNDLPHRLHLSIDKWGSLSVHRVECPYEHLGAKRPCALVEENPDYNFSRAWKPRPTSMQTRPIEEIPEGYLTSPEAVIQESLLAWSWAPEDDTEARAFLEALRYEDETPRHVPVDGCWVQHWIAEGGLSDIGFDEEISIPPVEVAWANEGGDYDDAELVLSHWKPPGERDEQPPSPESTPSEPQAAPLVAGTNWLESRWGSLPPHPSWPLEPPAPRSGSSALSDTPEAPDGLSEAHSTSSTRHEPEAEEQVRQVILGWLDNDGFQEGAHGACEVAAAVYGPDWVDTVLAERGYSPPHRL